MREETYGDGHRQVILSSATLGRNSQRMLILEAKRVQEELTQTVAWVSSCLARFIDQCCLPHIPPHISPTEGKGGGEKKKKRTKLMGFLPRRILLNPGFIKFWFIPWQRGCTHPTGCLRHLEQVRSVPSSSRRQSGDEPQR